MIPMEGGGYTSPGVEDFQFPGLFGTDWITKPMLQAVIAAIEAVLPDGSSPFGRIEQTVVAP